MVGLINYLCLFASVCSIHFPLLLLFLFLLWVPPQVSSFSSVTCLCVSISPWQCLFSVSVSLTHPWLHLQHFWILLQLSDFCPSLSWFISWPPSLPRPHPRFPRLQCLCGCVLRPLFYLFSLHPQSPQSQFRPALSSVPSPFPFDPAVPALQWFSLRWPHASRATTPSCSASSPGPQTRSATTPRITHAPQRPLALLTRATQNHL